MKKKYNLLFDGTILSNEFSKNDSRSGIFFVTKNIFNQMAKNTNIYIYCDLKKYEELKKFINKYDEYKNIQIINEHEVHFGYRLSSYFKKKKENYPKLSLKNKILRSICQIILLISSILVIFMNLFNFHLILKTKLKKNDFYFSPADKVPDIIKEQKHITASVFLHDTIPLLYKEYFPDVLSGDYWFLDLMKSLSKDEIYFANSQCTKNDFLNHSSVLTEEQISVVYLAASDIFYETKNEIKSNQIKEKYNIPKNDKYIFSLCTLEPRKNLIFAVKNFINFIKKNNINDMYFVIGGSAWNSFISEIKNTIEDLDLYKNKIIRAGYVDDEDLAYLYSNAFCFIYPSIYEGFGLPVLEAMKCGCPVITSNTSSMPEVIGDAGIKINPKNNEEFICALEKFYNNENFRQSCSQKGLELAKKFCWQKSTDTILNKLIENRRRRYEN